MDRLSRDSRWNLSLAVLVLSSALVAATGTAWAWIGTVLGAAVVLGAVLVLSLTGPIRRRLHNPQWGPYSTGAPFPMPFEAEQLAARRDSDLGQVAGIAATRTAETATERRAA